jgi:hypothetical protein
MNKNNYGYYYSINEILNLLAKKEAKDILKILNEEIGKERVAKQRYYKESSKNRVSMSLEESLIYKRILDLENTDQLLTDYTEPKETEILENFGYSN